MTFRRFHAFSLRFTGVFRPNNRLAEAAKSCHDLLMQDRLIVLALLATAACTSASAQIAQPLADGSGSAQILPLLDLNGEWWGDERGSIFNRYVPKARIEHQGKDFSVIAATENVPYYGQKFLGGSYSGETSFLLLRYPLSNPPRHVRITINDPDTVVIGGVKCERHTAPTINDIPCNSANPLHVQVSGAVARAGVAVDAKDIPLMVCWESVAASLGDAQAQYYMGLALRRGIGTEQNYGMAFEWLKKSVRQGNVDALKLVAEMHRHGEIQLTPEEEKQLNESLQFYLRAERNQQQAERMGQILDLTRPFSDAVKSVFGDGLYPGQNCGLSYRGYLNWKQAHQEGGDPCLR
jgi:TPR repeat protein